MQLDTELRQMLWSARHWERALCERAAALRAEPRAAELAAPARALAAALEDVVLDRSHAIEMYLLASKSAGGDPAALARARALASEIGQLALAARIASLERKRSGDPAIGLVEGEAWLDAGEPDRAIKPLLQLAHARPDSAGAARALAAARREWADVRAEIARLERGAAAEADGAAAAADHLHAARIVRMLGETAQARELVDKAYARDPLNDAAYALCEIEYVSAGDWNGLLEVYRRRAGAVPTAREVVETLRRGATRMSVSDGAPALAVTLAVRALGYAYDEGVRDIPGHAAMLDILCRHYIRARAADRLLPVIDRGLGAGLPEDDAMALAVVGLDVAWSHMGSARAAQKYAAWVESRAPDNPTLAAYRRRGGAIPVSAAEAEAEPELPEALELAEEPGAAGEFAAPEPEPAPMSSPEAQDEDPVEALEEAFATAVREEPEAPAAPASPIPAQATPPAPELEEMVELDPDDLVEIDEEESGSGLDVSAIADPGEGSTEATGPIRVLSKAPPAAEAEAAAPEHRPAPSPRPAAPSPKRPAPAPGAVSLIPGSAKKALEHIVRAPAGPPGKEAEKRADERVAVPADVSVAIEAKVVLGANGARGVTRDISRTGAFIVTDASLPRDVAFDVRLSLPAGDEMSLTEHALRAAIVREEPGVGYGVRFDDPSLEYERAVARLRGRDRG